MGGSSKEQTVGYKYYLGMHLVLTHGPVDALKWIKVDGRYAWVGNAESGSININSPQLFGGDSREGGVSGTVDFENGSPTQPKNSYLQSMLGAAIPAFRGVSALVLRQCYLGNNPYLKKWAARLQRIHKTQDGATQWYDIKAAIPVSDSSGIPTVNKTFNPNLAATTPEASADTVTISGLSADDYLIITPVPGSNSAWSRWLGYGEGAGYHNVLTDPLWFGEISVKNAAGSVSTFYETSYMTQAEAVAGVLAEGSKFLTGSTSYKIWLLDDVMFNRGSMSLKIEVAKYFDMNPAHIIRECLTNQDWGMGYQSADIDSVSFEASADALFDEGMGISILWDKQIPIEDFVSEIIRHIDAALYVDRASGKFVLKLIRADFVEADLITLNESNIEKVENYTRSAFGELVNSITVNYWESATGNTASVTADDPALIQLQESVIGTTLQYPGFTNRSIASRVAMRNLQALSAPLLSCTIFANRSAKDLNIGDVFKFEWPDYHNGYIVMRISGMAIGDGRNNTIRLTCMQDVFSLPTMAMVSNPTDEWEDVTTDAVASPNRIVVEAPYFELVQRLGQTDADSKITANNDIGYLIASASASAGAINARLAIDSGGGYSLDRTTPVDFCPNAVLTNAIDYDDTVIAVNSFVNLEAVQLGTHAQIGNELVKITAASSTSLTIGRGVLDTVPEQHAVGSVVMFWDVFGDSDAVEYVAGETVGAKILPTTGSGTLAIAEAPADSLTFVSRAYKPYPPGKLRINTLSYPATIGGLDLLALTWAHRDRLQQTAGDIVDTTAGNIGPEASTTYTLRIYGENDTLGREVTGIATTGYTYAEIDEKTDFFGVGGSDYSSSVLAFTPAAYWRFGEASGTTAADSGPNNLTGTYAGTYTLGVPSLIPSEADTCFSLNAAGHIDVPANATHFQMVGRVWGFTVQLSVVTNQCILHVGDNSNGSAQGIAFYIVDGALYVQYVVSAAFRNVFFNSVFTANSIDNIYLRFNSATSISLFKNGALFETQASLPYPVPTAPTKPLTIGAVKNGAAYHTGLKGKLDDLFVINSLLSDAQLLALHQKTSSSPVRLQGRLRVELESKRGSYVSYQKHNVEVLRTGYGYNYGKSYGN